VKLNELRGQRIKEEKGEHHIFKEGDTQEGTGNGQPPLRISQAAKEKRKEFSYSDFFCKEREGDLERGACAEAVSFCEKKKKREKEE